VIAVTRRDSPLARHAHVVVDVAAPENTELTAPMVSRIAYNLISDILATGVGLAMGAQLHEKLRRVKDSLAEQRMREGPRPRTTRKRRRVRITT